MPPLAGDPSFQIDYRESVPPSPIVASYVQSYSYALGGLCEATGKHITPAASDLFRRV
ncbi:MAG: hypothetical protein JJU06_09960 [Ectothiorhodospiraceae bacterium]|nr:hypothetical protein [Ectothiorhodospiraceae bacterium]MCH8504321.1 hypothetical protein [Ectothiorhodospiraceae bacterium]